MARRRMILWIVVGGAGVFLVAVVLFLFIGQEIPPAGLKTPESRVKPRIFVNNTGVILFAPDGSSWFWPRNGKFKPPALFCHLTNEIEGTLTNGPVQFSKQKWELLSVTDSFAAGVKGDGSLWVWGRLPRSDLETTFKNWTNHNEEEARKLDSSGGWKEIFVGANSAFLGLKKDGSVWCFGGNEHGQIGMGTNKFVPVLSEMVPGSRWRAAELNGFTGYGIREDGSLWYWGQAIQTPDGKRVGPVPVGYKKNWEKISVGYYGVIALKKDGTIWCSGPNSHVMNNGLKSVPPAEPYQVGQDNDWVDVKCDADCFYAVKKNGSCWAGGMNSGQLTVPVSNKNFMPMTKLGLKLDAWAWGFDNFETVMLAKDGSVWRWGGRENQPARQTKAQTAKQWLNQQLLKHIKYQLPVNTKQEPKRIWQLPEER